MYDPHITINRPGDDGRDMPIFEGLPHDAGKRLVPGFYRGTADYTDLADGMPESDAYRPGTLIVWDATPTDARLAAVLSGYDSDTGAVWSDDEFPTIDITVTTTGARIMRNRV